MEDRPRLPNHGVMLTLEAQPRRAVTKTPATNGHISCAAGEPPSSSSSSTSINNSGSRLPMHLTASSHSQPQRRYHPPYHFKVHHLFPDENPQDAVLRKNLPPLQYKVHDSAFCRVLSADTTAAALVAAAVCSGGVDRDIWKCGYLRKQKHGHKRFFVLRGPSNLGPSRLEYYDSEKKFRNALKAAASGVACPAKRVIYLSQCFTVNKRADAKNKYLIALYTKDEYFAVVAESEQEQQEWYLALTELMTEGKKGQLDNDELDDGYGTISPGTIFKEVWQVNVKPKGLGQTRNLMGVYRLCLSAKTIHLVKLNSETPAVNLPLMSIRRCGHSESFFFIEVGRSSSIGPGEIWVQVEDSVVAQNMHETILDTMKALKAFPDFRPRSKSQSSGSIPMPFITTRRHLGNLPPSQTGLQRPSRDRFGDGHTAYREKQRQGKRYRTSSEGEGTQDRPPQLWNRQPGASKYPRSQRGPRGEWQLLRPHLTRFEPPHPVRFPPCCLNSYLPPAPSACPAAAGTARPPTRTLAPQAPPFVAPLVTEASTRPTSSAPARVTSGTFTQVAPRPNPTAALRPFGRTIGWLSTWPWIGTEMGRGLSRRRAVTWRGLSSSLQIRPSQSLAAVVWVSRSRKLRKPHPL